VVSLVSLWVSGLFLPGLLARWLILLTAGSFKPSADLLLGHILQTISGKSAVPGHEPSY